MSHVDELIRAVWERPDDVELRLVLADAWLAADDPRGELIQLQRQPEVDDERRVMRLIQQHGLSWLGSLRGLVLPISYELGFLASCVAIDARAAGRIEWATVHTVELGIDEVGLLFDPVMRSLRRVTGVQDVHVRQLMQLRRCPRELAARVRWDRLPYLVAGLESIAALHVIELDGLRLTRGDDGRLSSLEVVYDDELPRLLENLPRDCIARLVVRGVAPNERAAVERTARAAQHRLATLELSSSRRPPR